jgi:hypothetical protein
MVLCWVLMMLCTNTTQHNTIKLTLLEQLQVMNDFIYHPEGTSYGIPLNYTFRAYCHIGRTDKPLWS